jgi:tRNA modification GTPase
VSVAPDTIAAIATPMGSGAIGVVRISGANALSVGDALFRRERVSVSATESHRAIYGEIVDPTSGDRLDDAVLTVFRAPHSYTGEHCVELSCHGGHYLLNRVLRACLDAGCRLAEPGEFTYRAFRNGKLDLSQAEAVADLIAARSEHALRAANRLRSGALSRHLEPLRQAVLDACAAIEAAIETDEEEPEPERSVILGDLDRLANHLRAMLAQAAAGRTLRLGYRLAILGRPNVGKSTLFNALLRRQRALVASSPGTTRDLIEETVEIGGLTVTLTDTAGIRTPRGQVERQGVALAMQAAEDADGALLVLDVRRSPDPSDIEIARRLAGRCVSWVLNKTDTLAEVGVARALERVRSLSMAQPALPISAATGDGIAHLESLIVSHAVGGLGDLNDILVTHERHARSLADALSCIENASAALTRGDPLDLVAVDLREGADALGAVIGVTSTEDVVARIFQRFCIGK